MDPLRLHLSKSRETIAPRFLIQSSRDIDLHVALTALGFERLLAGGLRVAIKPNLTWIDPRPGVTTTVESIRKLTAALAERDNAVSIVESDGGYGTFTADAAFQTHGLHLIAEETGAKLVNLSRSSLVPLSAGGQILKMPEMLLREVDVIVTMPVPKVHVLTKYSGAVKNQWGLIPTDMRLRRHYRLRQILTDLLSALPPQVVAMDGTYFLDQSGPIEGYAIQRDMMIFANHPLVADAVALRLMGWDLQEIPYLRHAASKLELDSSSIPDLPAKADHRFTVKRNFWNWTALAAFQSRTLTWLGYESPLAGPLHALKLGSEKLLRGVQTVSHRRRHDNSGSR